MRPPWLAPLLIVLLAAGLRVGWVATQWDAHGPRLAYPDEELHLELAANLVQQGALVSDDGRHVARMPAYPLFLALFAWLGDDGVLVARLAQALLGALVAWFAWRWAREAFGPRPALLAGLLVALDPFQVFFANLLLTEVLFSALLVGAGWFTWRCVRRRPGMSFGDTTVNADKPQLQFAALCLALAWMTRPSSAGWVLLVIALLAVFARDLPRGTARAGVCLAMLAACLLPWGVRNFAVVGAPALLSANGGASLYDAQGPQADASSDQTFMHELPELAGLDEIARDRRLGELAREQMAADPGRVLRLALAKLARTWNPFPNVAEYRAGAAAWAGAGYTLVLAGLALLGFLRGVRDRPRFYLLVLLPVVYFTLVHMVYVGSVRYRVPLMPCLALAAAPALGGHRRGVQT